MPIPTKTLASGFSLPVYGIGTWEMGGDHLAADYAQDEKWVRAIRHALESGVTHIDTAEMYGIGHTEELVGRAIQDVDRPSLQIISKVMGDHQGYDDLLRACEASLKRLGTNYLDVYLLHRFPSSGTDIRDTMKAMDRLVAEGMVRNIGVSNFTVNRMKVAQECTGNKIVCNQVHYSLGYREVVQRGVLEYCQQNDTLITAWGPLGKGLLKTANVLHQMADKYDKTPYQVALNWLITQSYVVTISKTSTPEHLTENLGALGWQLLAEDWQRLADEFPHQMMVSNRVPLDYEASREP
jgi:diketogulonate reductase-like aldo/keto reductase